MPSQRTRRPFFSERNYEDFVFIGMAIMTMALLQLLVRFLLYMWGTACEPPQSLSDVNQLNITACYVRDFAAVPDMVAVLIAGVAMVYFAGKRHNYWYYEISGGTVVELGVDVSQYGRERQFVDVLGVNRSGAKTLYRHFPKEGEPSYAEGDRIEL